MCCEDKCKIFKLILIFSIIFILFIAILFLCINNNQNKDKNILVATAQNGDNTETGDVIIKFSQNKIIVGDALSHTTGSSEIMINKDGKIYGYVTGGLTKDNMKDIINQTLTNERN